MAAITGGGLQSQSAIVYFISSSVLSRTFWFLPLDTGMIVEIINVYQISVKKKGSFVTS